MDERNPATRLPFPQSGLRNSAVVSLNRTPICFSCGRAFYTELHSISSRNNEPQINSIEREDRKPGKALSQLASLSNLGKRTAGVERGAEVEVVNAVKRE